MTVIGMRWQPHLIFVLSYTLSLQLLNKTVIFGLYLQGDLLPPHGKRGNKIGWIT